MLIASVKKLGEKYHDSSLKISQQIVSKNHVTICSSLILIELPGALAASTSMPVDKIYEVQLSVFGDFHANIMPYENYVKRTVDLMLEFRQLKSKWQIGSADFHYIATACQEDCDLFITTDEKHLLRKECKDAFSKYIQITAPDAALAKL